MKKIFSLLMVAFLVLPCAILFSACGNDNSKTNDPETIEISQVYQVVLNNLERLTNNSTFTTDVSYEYNFDSYSNGQKSTSNEKSNEFNNNILKIDNGNFYFYLPESVESYTFKTGETYSKDMENNAWSLYHDKDEAVFPGAAYVTVLKEIIEKMGADQLFDEIKELAVSQNENALTVEQIENEKVITLTLDLSTLINKTLTNLLANKDNNLDVFVNQFIKDFNGKEVNVMNSLKTFTDAMTAETTIEDLIAFCSNSFGLNIQPVISFVYGTFAYSTLSPVNYIFSNNLFMNVQGNTALSEIVSQPQDTNILDFNDTKLYDLITEGNSTGEKILNLFKGYLQNSNFTIKSLIERIMSSEEGDETQLSIEEIFDKINIADIKKLELCVEVKLNTNDIITNFKFTGTGDCSILDSTQTGIKANGTAEINLQFSDIGNTNITAPQTDISLMNIVKHIDKSLITNDDIIISMASYPDFKNNFEIKVGYNTSPEGNPVFDTDNPTTIASYDKTSNNFTISKDFYNKISVEYPEVNSISFNSDDNSFSLQIIFE